ncbi:tetratricopeptide repeat protein [Treponema sp. OMZ 805]|uniref:tetratricopeptide repeat protein n=1 Tax=Treponema sp. OMZ 805 TaxID=2726068 RepID=UPI003D906518
MLKTIKRRILLIEALLVCLLPVTAAYSQTINRELQQMNTSYALQYLQKAAEFYTDANYAEALEYVEKGMTFDDSFADFFYLKAQCLIQLDGTRAQCLDAAETALTSGLKLRIYNRDNLVLLLARLYTETEHYSEAIQVLDSLAFDSADRDFYRAAALYGLGRDGQARDVIEIALSRWSFDVRFPRLFFLQERDKAMTRAGKKLADALLQQLYVWIEQEPSLAVYAAPFDPNPKENSRRLKVYRSMYEADNRNLDARTQLAAVLAELRYGVIDEKTAIKEFFAVTVAAHLPQRTNGKAPTSALYSDQLIELCRLTGTNAMRKEIGNRLKTFSGVLLEDDNRDGISDTVVFFEQGRPVSAYFDLNQDEVYEYQVQCNFGAPDLIFTPKNGYAVQYDSYPAVHSIVQKAERREYIMRPLALRWEPVSQTELDLRLRDTDAEAPAFFTLRLRNNARLLQEHDFIFSVLYSEEPAPSDNNALMRMHFEDGRIISAEIKTGTKTLALARYRNGVLAQKEYDYDGDGFFEVLEQYGKQGKLEKISVDINKNKLFEYYEMYKTDGTIIKNWDKNEDGIPEIQYTQFPSGNAQTVWKHRYSGLPVSVYYKKGTPERLTIGKTSVPLIKDPTQNIYWLEMRPSFSDKVAEKLAELFKDTNSYMEARTVIIGSYELYAVRSEGAVFVQMLRVPERAVPVKVEGRK